MKQMRPLYLKLFPEEIDHSNQLINQSINQLYNESINESIVQSVNQSIDRSRGGVDTARARNAWVIMVNNFLTIWNRPIIYTCLFMVTGVTNSCAFVIRYGQLDLSFETDWPAQLRWIVALAVLEMDLPDMEQPPYPLVWEKWDSVWRKRLIHLAEQKSSLMWNTPRAWRRECSLVNPGTLFSPLNWYIVVRLRSFSAFSLKLRNITACTFCLCFQ